jgi:hypothetical protein
MESVYHLRICCRIEEKPRKALIELHLDRVITERQNNDHLQSSILTAFLFADEQVILTASEGALRTLPDRLCNAAST